MIVYLPILTLEGVEGKLFRPMALTVIFALLGVAGPVADADARARLARAAAEDQRARRRSSTAWPTGSSSRSSARACGHPMVDARLRRARSRSPRPSWAFASARSSSRGSNEGTIVINTIRLASVSLEESLDYGTRIEALLKEEFPDEIEHDLEPDRDRRGGDRPDGLGGHRRLHHAEAPRAVEEGEDAGGARRGDGRGDRRRCPACGPSTAQPIEMRINEMVAGIRADLGIKLFGDDLEVLKAKAAEIERVVKAIPGAADVDDRAGHGPARAPDRGRSRGPLPLRRPGRGRCSTPSRRSGGIEVGEIIEPGRRFPLVVRLPDDVPRRPERPGEDPHPDRVRAAAPAHPARPARGDDRAPRPSSASGASGGSSSRPTSGAATSARSSRRPRSGSAAR